MVLPSPWLPLSDAACPVEADTRPIGRETPLPIPPEVPLSSYYPLNSRRFELGWAASSECHPSVSWAGLHGAEGRSPESSLMTNASWEVVHVGLNSGTRSSSSSHVPEPKIRGRSRNLAPRRADVLQEGVIVGD